MHMNRSLQCASMWMVYWIRFAGKRFPCDDHNNVPGEPRHHMAQSAEEGQACFGRHHAGCCCSVHGRKHKTVPPFFEQRRHCLLQRTVLPSLAEEVAASHGVQGNEISVLHICTEAESVGGGRASRIYGPWNNTAVPSRRCFLEYALGCKTDVIGVVMLWRWLHGVRKNIYVVDCANAFATSPLEMKLFRFLACSPLHA